MTDKESVAEVIDGLFSSMDGKTREELKRSIRLYQKSGDESAKRTVLDIIGACDDKETICKLLILL